MCASFVIFSIAFFVNGRGGGAEGGGGFDVVRGESRVFHMRQLRFDVRGKPPIIVVAEGFIVPAVMRVGGGGNERVFGN